MLGFPRAIVTATGAASHPIMNYLMQHCNDLAAAQQPHFILGISVPGQVSAANHLQPNGFVAPRAVGRERIFSFHQSRSSPRKMLAPRTNARQTNSSADQPATPTRSKNRFSTVLSSLNSDQLLFSISSSDSTGAASSVSSNACASPGSSRRSETVNAPSRPGVAS